MLDDDFVERLIKLPKAEVVINELFDTVESVSEQRLYVAIVDVERIKIKGRNCLMCQDSRKHLVTQQFAEYFNQVNVPIEQLPDQSMANLFRRLQMLAYSQFWECLSIQRLLTQLVNIAEERPYNPELLIKIHPNTNNIYESLIAGSKRLNLKLAEFLSGTYSNQVRNAFAHSEFYTIGEYISLSNYNSKLANHIPSLSIQTWDKLFAITGEFIIALFKSRRACIEKLKGRAPFRIQLNEFARPFDLIKDDRGYWITQFD